MDNTSDAIIVFDNKGVVETLNREAQQLFCGNSKEKIDQIWEIITPENKENFFEKLKKVSEGKRITDYETERIGKDGKRISVSISLVYMNQGNGRFIETIRDISERLVMRNKIIELEKAQIIGKMAEGFAHHMGTPLASMLLRVQMLKDDILDLPEYEDVGEKLNSIERQILYGQKVIQRLLKFVGRPGNEKSPENISNLLEESIEIIRPLIKKKGIVLETDIDDALKILADTNLIHLVFSDTMMNAIDAMPEGGVLSIISFKDETTQSVNVKMKDTGVGISKETIPFVFEPFFTTKPAGKGTGLGLSVAKSIVHEHGGDINIKSKQGSGTIVSISFPILNEEKIS
jgi:PAS domain S-box-containing protein